MLGAVVSPPDAVAATAIFQRLGAPRRIVTILEGESLINDASAIVVYTFAVAAVVSGSFSLPDALLNFVVVVVIGLAVGLAVGLVLGKLVMLLGDPSLSITALLLAPAVAYVVGEALGGSGVLAVVMAGLIHGHFSSRTMSPSTRIRGIAIWDLVTILVNGFVFLLMGMELGVLREVMTGQRAVDLLWHAGAVLVAMVIARFLYVFAGSRDRRHRSRATAPLEPRAQFLIAWSGLRGVVSMAMALALPTLTDAGAPFDHRDEIILIAAAVIVASLFGFGLPLPWLLRKLRFADDDSHERELRLAWMVVRRAMVDQIQQTLADAPELEPVLQPALKEMETRIARMRSMEDADRAELIGNLLKPRMLNRQKAIGAARTALLELRDRGDIGDEVRREVERNLDLQELQLAV